MKKRIISSVLTASLLVGSGFAVNAEELWGKASDWAVDELKTAEESNLIPKILENSDLTQMVTREEFAEISVKVYEALAKKTAEAAEANPFTDTANAEILKAYSLGITNGVTETEFEPDSNLTREQAAAMLSRAYMKAYEMEKLPDYEITKEFADDSSISDWAKESVYFMAANGVISGTDETHFSPKYISESERESGYGCATREQSLLIAVRILDKLADNNTPTDNTPENNAPEDETGGQPPIITAEQDGNEADSEKETFTIGFIGGSLTQGGSVWINAVKRFFQNEYPDKNIKTINAGIGGTGSDMGAMRYKKDILDSEPDLVFIEFAVNDNGRSEDNSKMYMENMVRQSLDSVKVPKIIFLYAPYPGDKDNENYIKWNQGVQWKEEIARHYGIKSINVYDYMYKDYTEMKKEKPEMTFVDYLGQYYPKSGSGFDVHGGYMKYAEAITQEFEKDLNACLTEPQRKGVKTKSDVANEKYRMIYASSARMHYTANDWNVYTESEPYNGGKQGHDIGSNAFVFPYFPEGIRQTEKSGAQFGYNTTPGTTAICVSYISSTVGASATVTVDGQNAGTVSCKSPYHNVNYTTNWINLPNDGKEHKIIFKVDGINASDTVFRFGGIVEKY